MRKKQFRFWTMSMALALGIGLSSCGSETPTEPENPSADTGENNQNNTDNSNTDNSNTEDNTVIEKKDRYTDISKTLKLNKEYENKTFEVDGIEEVVLVTATDGDTATFRTKNSDFNFRVRFYAIDTPESTGSVEKWGKSASKYTANVLENSYALLVESKETKVNYSGQGSYSPERDSYGERFLGYVWYKETADSDWVNLNLEIVENGYSENKCPVDSEYSEYFKSALAFAKKVPLHIWNRSEEDPYYNASATEVTVKELATNASAYYNAAEGTGSKVHFTGFVSDVYVSASGTYTYKVSEFDTDGTMYTFDVYAGYASTSIPTYMKIGGIFSFTGSIQEHNGKYQVSGLTYVAIPKKADHLKKIQEQYYMVFDSSIEYSQTYFASVLYNDATVKTATLDGNTLIITAEACNTYKVKNSDNTKDTFTFNCDVSSVIDTTQLIGKTFSVKAYQEVAESKVLTVKNYSDFNWK